MSDRNAQAGPDLVNVVLEGGPGDFPTEARRRTVSDSWTIKVPHGNGYEHFERVPGPESGATDPVVYRWTTRTRIAE